MIVINMNLCMLMGQRPKLGIKNWNKACSFLHETTINNEEKKSTNSPTVFDENCSLFCFALESDLFHLGTFLSLSTKYSKSRQCTHFF